MPVKLRGFSRSNSLGLRPQLETKADSLAVLDLNHSAAALDISLNQKKVRIS